MNEFTLYVGHGSRDADGNEEFLQFIGRVIEQTHAQTQNAGAEACFLELAAPTIPQGIAACIARGADRIVIVPVILLAASHVKMEIPEFIDAARKQYPHVDFVYGRNVGLHEKIIDLLLFRFQQEAGELSAPELAETAIVLMGRGSSDPDANGDLYKIARQLWERTGVQTVEVCFTGITFPRLPEGIGRALALGAKRLVVVPYFLFTGILIKRMQILLSDLQSQHPQIRMTMAEYFGMHQDLAQIVLERREEARIGRSFMNCDLCQYRKLAASDHGHSHDHDHSDGHHPRQDADDALIKA